MSFTFGMCYKPDYQKRLGDCRICHQGIVAGEKIMIGTGYFNGHLIRNHNHYDCWYKEVEARAGLWFFANKYEPKRMTPEKKAELNRLYAKRHYINKKGGEPNAKTVRLVEVEKRIALVKAG